jgi:hypothetical protein
MIPKKPAPDPIRGGNRFSEKIMLKQQAGAGWRFEEKSSRYRAETGAFEQVAGERPAFSKTRAD